ncbi:RHS repeat-associated core domain-containing protein [Lentisphaerota bacterium WC36G]|nr:RHS repeat-associated core domain-containing protein [Lentisphaerae bacterium WC36]
MIVLAEDSTGKKSSVVKDIPNSESYVYDVNGNLKNDGNYNYYWNCENRLVKMLNTTQKLEFKYDYMGRRREKKVFEKENNEWVLKSHKSFIYNKYKLIKTVDELNNGSISDRFVWLGDNLLALEKDGVVFNYIADGNKNITQLIDMSSGSIANRYDYSPFGQLSLDNETVANPFKFSSEYAEKETGLVYYNYRYYNPSTGKWLSRDPIQEAGGVNVYGFIKNSTINYYDLLGLHCRNCGVELKDCIKNALESFAKNMERLANELVDLEFKLFQEAFKQFTDAMNASQRAYENRIEYCESLPRKSILDKISYMSCKAGAATAHAVATGVAAASYAKATLAIGAIIAAYKAGEMAFYKAQLKLEFDECIVNFGSCRAGYGKDKNGCPCD